MPLITRRYAEHIPRDPSSPWYGEHLARYREAASRAADALVLDIACGPGLGFADLLGTARFIAGADLDREALTEAMGSVVPGRVGLSVADGCALPYRTRSFEVIACFETVEHVTADTVMVKELARVLADGGIALISTPNAQVTKPVDGTPRNPFHVREYRREELRHLLETHFDKVSLFGQRATGAGSAFWQRPPGVSGLARSLALKASLRVPRPLVRGLERVLRRPLFPGPGGFEFTSESIDRCHALLAICRQPRREASGGS